MEEKAHIFPLKIGSFTLYFDVTICAMVLLTCLLIFLFVFICSRNMQLKPKGKQNLLEMLVEFIHGIVSGNLPSSEVTNFHLLAFVTFMFVLVSNILGLVTKITDSTDTTHWKSPTADPLVTLTLAFMMLLLTHIFSLRKFGIKKYFVHNFLEPMAFLAPMKLMEEFTNVLTLGLRLYGNIFAGEVLLSLIASMARSHGAATFIVALPIEMIWQAFSIFIGAIQAYVFVTLSMVYLSHKIASHN